MTSSDHLREKISRIKIINLLLTLCSIFLSTDSAAIDPILHDPLTILVFGILSLRRKIMFFKVCELMPSDSSKSRFLRHTLKIKNEASHLQESPTVSQGLSYTLCFDFWIVILSTNRKMKHFIHTFSLCQKTSLRCLNGRVVIRVSGIHYFFH
jgi:hypothetical protein